jgi:hypothetical protein
VWGHPQWRGGLKDANVDKAVRDVGAALATAAKIVS